MCSRTKILFCIFSHFSKSNCHSTPSLMFTGDSIHPGWSSQYSRQLILRTWCGTHKHPNNQAVRKNKHGRKFTLFVLYEPCGWKNVSIFCFHTITSACILARVMPALYGDETTPNACITSSLDGCTVASTSFSESRLVSTFVNAVTTPHEATALETYGVACTVTASSGKAVCCFSI